ncbi:hypothetical protein OQJ19_07345 [Fluoribacter gormanii]|uniref:Uncharacterized protein n=1 Tax=Fluoribacter gormanii TaxID=464 RepID=A0A377GNL3_9GAMM|nr:hypothetical protein [Fluoribacter gormanii]KTD00531.1 hypothetical protein Lgor_3007 [Fluoribacter gormanii]MCW8470470.1 hypothetical protein [Fluoribacter gormanii]SIR07322.1 hypothetical protein SAMN05421777_10650 [Fluoribacter gormanii]STO26391.1 Uncharacterised protein [Fluoribacter gormanii]
MEYKRDRNIEQDSEYSRTQDQYYYPRTKFSHSQPKKVFLGKEPSIFDACLGTPREKEGARAAFKGNAMGFYSEAQRVLPGFFAPLRNKKEFATLAAAPIVSPVILVIASAASAIAAAGAALTALGSLVFAAGAGLHSLRKPEAKETTQEALMVAAKAGIVAAACAAITIAAALLAVVLTPVALTYFVTRSGATVVNATSKCISTCSSKENAEKEENEESSNHGYVRVQ